MYHNKSEIIHFKYTFITYINIVFSVQLITVFFLIFSFHYAHTLFHILYQLHFSTYNSINISIPIIKLLMCVCLYAFFSAISKPTGTPFGTKLPLGPGMVLKQQYLGKHKKNVETACQTKKMDFRFGSVTKKYDT